MMKYRTYTLYILLTLFLFSVTTAAYGQASDWIVPQAKKEVKNPVEPTDRSINSGKKLYQSHCKSCHGDPGKNNGLPLQPHPTDMLDPMVQNQTSGEIFYRITEGKGAMPSFKNVLSEDDRWNVVNYVHSLGGNTKKAAVTSPPTENKEGISLPTDESTLSPVTEAIAVTKQGEAKIEITTDPANRKLEAYLTDLGGNPIPNVEVIFYAQRYFGRLPLHEESLYTDAKGYASIVFPDDIIGNDKGVVHIICKVFDEDDYGIVEESSAISWGVKKEVDNILGHRNLWTVNRYAPIWLIITYFGILIGVWAFLAYVIFSLFKIKSINKIKE